MSYRKNLCLKNKVDSIVAVALLCIVTRLNMEKRKCLFKKCGAEFTPSKNKQVYCSTKCRTYAYRESLSKINFEKTTKDCFDGKKNKTTVQVINEAAKNMGKTAVAVNEATEKHPLWKEGDPKEGSIAFYKKYGVATYAEIKK